MINKTSRYLVIAILAVVFTAVIFIIPFDKKGVFSWMGYAFEMVAILSQLLFMKLAFDSDNNELKSKLYGYPIFRIGYIYLIVQTIVSVIFLIVGAFLWDGELWWVATLIEILIVAAAALGLIGTIEAKSLAEQYEVSNYVDTSFIDGLKVEISTISSMCSGKPCASAAEKLYETIRYSDPVSVPALKAVEDNINNNIMMLRTTVMEGNDDGVIQQCANITLLMNDRNARVKTLKK